MKPIIALYRSIVVQIATPYSSGTGFYLKDYHLIVTNEHVVSGNREVIIEGALFKKTLTPVLYTDTKYDLAFLQPPLHIELPYVPLGDSQKATEGDIVLVMGHPFGLKFTATQGIISNTRHLEQSTYYIQTDAALNPGNSGGPLVDSQGEVIGINTYIIKTGQNLGFALPAAYLKKTLKEYLRGDRAIGTRCPACATIVFPTTIEQGYCANCGAKVTLPSAVEVYQPMGVPKNIEQVLSAVGVDVRLARRGPASWEIDKGTATIHVSYHQQQGIIFADALLALLPKENIKPIYTYLLQENYHLRGITLSIKEQEVVLSLMIIEKYFHAEVAKKLLLTLFEKADYYDTQLVEKMGALRRRQATDDPGLEDWVV